MYSRVKTQGANKSNTRVRRVLDYHRGTQAELHPALPLLLADTMADEAAPVAPPAEAEPEAAPAAPAAPADEPEPAPEEEEVDPALKTDFDVVILGASTRFFVVGDARGASCRAGCRLPAVGVCAKNRPGPFSGAPFAMLRFVANSSAHPSYAVPQAPA